MLNRLKMMVVPFLLLKGLDSSQRAREMTETGREEKRQRGEKYVCDYVRETEGERERWGNTFQSDMIMSLIE